MTEETSEQVRGSGGISRRTAAWLAWSLWALAFALTALSLLLLILNLSHPDTHVFDWWLGNATVVIDATVGAIVEGNYATGVRIAVVAGAGGER